MTDFDIATRFYGNLAMLWSWDGRWHVQAGWRRASGSDSESYYASGDSMVEALITLRSVLRAQIRHEAQRPPA